MQCSNIIKPWCSVMQWMKGGSIFWEQQTWKGFDSLWPIQEVLPCCVTSRLLPITTLSTNFIVSQLALCCQLLYKGLRLHTLSHHPSINVHIMLNISLSLIWGWKSSGPPCIQILWKTCLRVRSKCSVFGSWRCMTYENIILCSADLTYRTRKPLISSMFLIGQQRTSGRTFQTVDHPNNRMKDQR